MSQRRMGLMNSQWRKLLHVSRPFLIKLLEHGAPPHHKVGKHRRLRAWQDGLRADCSKRRIGYYPLSTATPAADILLRDLRRGGLLR